MASNLNTQAIGLANQLIALISQAENFQLQIDSVVTQYNLVTAGTTLSAMSTITPNPDGTLPATSDGAPNAAHPISPLVYPTISRAVLATDLASAVTGLTAISTLIKGAAAAQQGQLPQLVAKFTGS